MSPHSSTANELATHPCDVCGASATEAWIDVTHAVDRATGMVSYAAVGVVHYGCRRHGHAFWLVFNERLECPTCSSELQATRTAGDVPAAYRVWCPRCQPDRLNNLQDAAQPSACPETSEPNTHATPDEAGH